MTNTLKGVQVRTGTATRVPGNPLENGATARLPHERDEADDSQASAPREDMAQAAADLARGLVDTDCHGARGIDQTGADSAASACPATPATRSKPRTTP
jgi:hypothetical protein